MERREKALLTITAIGCSPSWKNIFYGKLDDEGKEMRINFDSKESRRFMLHYNMRMCSLVVDAELTDARRPVCNVLKVHEVVPRRWRRDGKGVDWRKE